LAIWITMGMKSNDQTYLVEKILKYWMCSIKLVKTIDSCFYAWNYLVRTCPNDVNVWIFWKHATNSQNDWFYCFICLKIIKTFLMEITISFSIDINMKPMNCNIGKRGAIHNFNCYFKKWVIYNILNNYNIFLKKK